MKLTHLNVQNFLGARDVDIALTTPITLFAGSNGAGKSSLQEAVRMALTGEAVRVSLKKDYAQLITEGETSGFAEVRTRDDGVYSILLPSGKGTCLADGHALPYVLNAQRFARLEPNERRAFLFGLMGLSTDPADIKRRLLARGCEEAKVNAIAPLLRAGFDAGHKEAQAKSRDEKSAWRTITGETYGEKKAPTWRAEKPEFDQAKIAELQLHLNSLDDGISELNQQLGAMRADHKRQSDSAQRLAELREKGSRYARISEKLMRDEEEMNSWESKVSVLKKHIADKQAVRNEPTKLACPDCGVVLMAHEGGLAHWYHEGVSHTISDADEAKLPAWEKALKLMQSAVANDKRDLEEADAAAKALAELEKITGTAPDDAQIDKARLLLDDLKQARNDIAAKLASQQDAERHAKQADERTAKAIAAHQSVIAWGTIADALAPDGIAGEILNEALAPLNERLCQSAYVSEWGRVIVTPSMEIEVQEQDALANHSHIRGRPYALLSESEQWRADAMLAEAVAHLSKIKLLVLDRFDVLDLTGRGDLIAWLDLLAKGGEIDTALVFGTLKALPANLPPTIAAHWIEGGTVAQLKEAA